MSLTALDLALIAIQKAGDGELDKLLKLQEEIRLKIQAVQPTEKTEDELFGAFLGDGKTLIERYRKWDTLAKKERRYVDFWEMKFVKSLLPDGECSFCGDEPESDVYHGTFFDPFSTVGHIHLNVCITCRQRYTGVSYKSVDDIIPEKL